MSQAQELDGSRIFPHNSHIKKIKLRTSKSHFSNYNWVRTRQFCGQALIIHPTGINFYTLMNPVQVISPYQS